MFEYIGAMNATLSLGVTSLARTCKALGDETRLRIVALLAHGELCVCHLEQGLKLTQPTASRQLAILKNAGIVESRRQGTWIHYRLSEGLDEACRRQLRALTAGFEKQAVLRKEVARLLRWRKPGDCA
jgi:ArsR family transcriptional regulator